MKEYIISENIKLKCTFTKKIIFIAPLLTGVMSTLFGGPLNMQNMVFYWWYSFFLPGVIAISASLMDKNEKKAGNYNGLYLLPINLKKAWVGKNVVLGVYLLLTQIIVFFIVLLPKLLGINGIVFSTEEILLGCLIIWIGSLPQLPILLYLAKRFGFAAIVFGNCILGLFLPVICAERSFWFLIPHCYTGRLVKEIIGLDINGLYTQPNIQNCMPTLCKGLLAIVIVTVIGLYITAKLFERQEVN